MSKTPRTDAEKLTIKHYADRLVIVFDENNACRISGDLVDIDFARQIETELAAIKSELINVKKSEQCWIENAKVFEAARVKVEKQFANLANEKNSAYDQAIEKLAKVEKELASITHLERERNETANVFMAQVKKLQSIIAELKKEISHLKNCVGHWTTDGKPVPCNSTLYLYPNNDTSREPMKLRIAEASYTCWYLTPEEHRTAIDVAKKGTE
jgi:hypothetical protein